MEIWKSIENYEGFYEVSNHGRVRSLTRKTRFGRGYRIYEGKELSLQTDKDGYKRVALHREGKVKRFFVHRLVALAFIDNPCDKPVVNHKDGNKQNNHADNLEWATNSENDIHAFKTGLRVAHDGGTSKKVIQIDKDTLEVLGEYNSISEASRKTGVSIQMISYCCNGKCKTAKGFVWKFK